MISVFSCILQETQDLFEASMKVSQCLNLFFQTSVFYGFEELIYLDAGFSIERGLLDAPSYFQHEILLAARGGENLHLILNLLERVLFAQQKLSLLKIFHDIHFHPTEIVYNLLTVSIG
jgi:hypothetical protein